MSPLTRMMLATGLTVAVASSPAPVGAGEPAASMPWQTLGCGALGALISQMILEDEGEVAGHPASRTAYPSVFNVHAVSLSASGRHGADETATPSYRAIAPWITVYPDRANPVATTRIEVGPPTIQYLSKRAGRYQALGPMSPMSGAWCLPGSLGGRCEEAAVVRLSTGQDAVTIAPNFRFAGRWSARAIDPRDIATIVVSVPMRVVGLVAQQTRLLARAGADFHEQSGQIATKPMRLSAGVSSLRRLDTEWQAIAFTAIRDGGLQIPGGGLSVGQLIAEPPPCVRS